jgi:hypothetical protein
MYTQIKHFVNICVYVYIYVYVHSNDRDKSILKLILQYRVYLNQLGGEEGDENDRQWVI